MDRLEEAKLRYPPGTLVKDAYGDEGIVPNHDNLIVNSEGAISFYYTNLPEDVYLYSENREKWATIVKYPEYKFDPFF